MKRYINLAIVCVSLMMAAGGAGAANLVYDNFAHNNGTTFVVGAGDTLVVGSGPSNYFHVASGGGTSGVLDASASLGVNANVGNFYVGTGGSGGNGDAYLGANNTITASTLFGVGTSFWDWTYGDLFTPAGSTTTIHTPEFKVGWATANGTSSGTGTFTIGAGASLALDGLSGGRTAMWVGYDEEQYGRPSPGTMDLSAGTANLKLSFLMVGGQTGNASTTGTLTMGASGSNHLDVSGAGNVVRIGYLGLFGTNGTGSGTGTVTLANLDATSSVTSTDNSTAIVLGERVATASGSTTGTLNLNGGTLTITTTGTAIGTRGSGGTSNLNMDGITLKAGASSSAWITGLTSAKIKSGGVTFDSNGYDITVPQALLTDAGSPGGGLTKAGAGTLTLSGANTFTGATVISGGKLVFTSASALLSSSVSIGTDAELQYNSATSLGVAPVFTGTGGTFSATGTVNGSVDVTAGNTLAAGNPGGTLTLSGLTLGNNTTVRVASGGSSLIQVNGDYADSMGAHTLVTGLATPGTPYTFIQWTGGSGSLSDGAQSNWTVQEGDTGTKQWTSASSGVWTTASAWDGFTGGVSADTTARTLSYTMNYVTSGNKAPTGGNDVIIDPTASGITVTGSGTAATVKSLQVGGTNNNSPTLALGAGALSVTETLTVAGNGALNASAGALVVPTLNVTGSSAAATLGHASSQVTTANVSAGVLTVNGGTVATANLSGTGTLGGSQAVAQVNVAGGTPTLTGRATTLTVTGGSVTTTSGAMIGTLDLPTGSTGTVVVGSGGATVANVDFSAGAGSVDATHALTVSGELKKGSITITAGSTPFKVGGGNLVSQLGTIVLQGSTTKIEQTTGGWTAGLDVRAWQNTGDAVIDGSRFDISVGNPAGSSTHSTFAGTIGYATTAINMSGNDQEHFGTNTNSGVPNESTRPTGYANNYTLEYRGKLYIATDGTYRFATTSDDGSALWINPGDVTTANPSYGSAAVQNSNWQGMTTRNSGQISLTAGYHDFIVRFYEGGGGNGLQVQWDPTGGTSWSAIPGSNFYHGGLVYGAINMPDTDVAVTADSALNLNYAGGSTLGDLGVTAGVISFQTATGVSFDNITATGTGTVAAGTPISLRGGSVSVAASQTLTVNANIVDGASATALTKSGTGSLILAGANSYTGATAVNEGTLEISGTGSINSSSGITIAGSGRLDYNSSVALTKPVGLSGSPSSRAVLGGSGSINAAVTLDSTGDVLSPGNSPGILPFATGQSWSSFGFDWEINDFTETTAGTDFDQITIDGSLALTGGIGSYILNVLSLTTANVAGNVWNFSEIDRTWDVLTTTGGITGFDAANWTVDDAGFTNNETGTWSVSSDGSKITLAYVIPEPATFGIVLGALAAVVIRRRRFG